MNSHTHRFALVALLLVLSFAVRVETADFYVSPSGSDDNPGTEERPFATLGRARDAARQKITTGLESDLTVEIRGGTYRIAEPIVFGPRDGGTDAFRVTYAAHPGETPVITGGRVITGWKSDASGAWRTTLPDVKSGKWRFRQLFVDGRRAARARHPDTDYFRVEKVGEDKRTNFRVKAGDLRAFQGLEEIELVFLHDWSITRVPLQSIDESERVLMVQHKIGGPGTWTAMDWFEKHPRYYLENSKDFLDAPGEWYLERETGVLRYRPLPGERPGEVEVVAPVAAQLLVVRGAQDGKRPVRNLHFRGLHFEHTAWSPPDGVYWGRQACTYWTVRTAASGRIHEEADPAAVEFDLTESCSFENGRIAHTGASAIVLGRGSRKSRVAGSLITDIGGNGIMVGEGQSRTVGNHQWWSVAPDEAATGNVVANNIVEECGRLLYGAVGIWVGLAGETTVSRNEVRQLPYTGISVGWMWWNPRWYPEPRKTPCRRNIIAGNHIHHVMLKLSDGGGIYTLGNQPGSELRGNLIHDVPANVGRAESNGMFLDQGTGGFVISKNVIYGVDRSPLRFHKGWKNIVRDNTLEVREGIPIVRYNDTVEDRITLENNTSTEKVPREVIDKARSETGPERRERLFTSGPQEFGGKRYYWLAEWKLEVSLPDDVAVDDRFEVLFGSKGPERRTLFFEYDGQRSSMADVRPTAYEWIEIPLGRLSRGKKVTLFGRGQQNVAFLAGVRISGKSTSAPKVRPIRTATTLRTGDGVPVWSELPGFSVDDDARRIWDPSPQKPDWRRAERSSRYAGIALSKVQRWLYERCLPVRDQRSGLFRPTGRLWTYRDTAADCYPFYVWAAYYTDLRILETVMLETLEAERRLCNHLDHLPVPFDMDEGRKEITPFDRMIFGASEYAKDGLTPIIEITGKKYPWYDRMRELVDDIFKHAATDTPYGKIPSTNIEVNGELLQLLPRLYSMTGEEKYLDWAHRLADDYLLGGSFVPSRLSDHGCEIIGGLGLLFAVDATARPKKCEEYKPYMEHMFDEILRRGRNSDGIIVGQLQNTEGPHDNVSIRDGWGYDFVGFLDYDLALGTQRYREAIHRPLTNLLKPRYKEFNWDSNSRDNIADSVEGGLYLLYRLPTTEAFVWADREIATLLVDHTAPDRLWDTHKLEANTVRTVLIHTMLHTRNTIARPWRQGLRLGAAPYRDGICLFMQSDKAYEGRLEFDIPRHRLYMGFRQDWPRLNAVPEWFTVEPDELHRYEVKDADTQAVRRVSGKALSEGLPVRLEPGKALRWIVLPRE